MNPVIRTLIIDDSAFVRKVVKEILSRSPNIEVVGTARDGLEGLEMVAELKPDVVTCDLMMPNLDGLGFVRQQVSRRHLPILLLTASSQDASQVLEALNAGAFDFMQKPSALATNELMSIGTELIAKVLAAGGAAMKNVPASAIPVPVRIPEALPARAGAKIDVVLIGISTGGPQALRHFIPEFPANMPVAVAIVLHMPVGYTALFAEKLNEISQLEVMEAQEGALMRPGVALLAQAGRHLTFRRNADGVVAAHLSVHPSTSPHRPSVDMMFQSAAEIYGGRTLGVVMTGMGDDGRQGAGWIKAKGGTIFTEAESSCIIYGMPRCVVEAGLSDRAVTMKSMAQAILDRL